MSIGGIFEFVLKINGMIRYFAIAFYMSISCGKSFLYALANINQKLLYFGHNSQT